MSAQSRQEFWKEPLSAFSITPVADSKGLKSFCWKHFGALIHHVEGKRKAVDCSCNYCSECLKSAKEKAEERKKEKAEERKKEKARGKAKEKDEDTFSEAFGR